MKMQEKGFYLPLGRSRYLLSYSLLAHMLAVISIFLINISSVVKILFITGIFINQFFHISRLGYLREYKKRPVALINAMNSNQPGSTVSPSLSISNHLTKNVFQFLF